MSKQKIALAINGKKVEAEVDARLLLVHFLREQQNLTGTHIGCDTSHCGVCTVDVDGQSINRARRWRCNVTVKVSLQSKGLPVALFCMRFSSAFHKNMGCSAASALPAC